MNRATRLMIEAVEKGATACVPGHEVDWAEVANAINLDRLSPNLRQLILNQKEQQKTMPENTQQTDFMDVDDLTVASWSPGAEGEGIPPTQVHILYRVPLIDAQFVMRIKSREACDELINALVEHRDHVFGSEKKGK